MPLADPDVFPPFPMCMPCVYGCVKALDGVKSLPQSLHLGREGEITPPYLSSLGLGQTQGLPLWLVILVSLLQDLSPTSEPGITGSPHAHLPFTQGLGC